MAGDLSDRAPIVNLLVTGAGGWVGQALLGAAAQRRMNASALNAREPAAIDFDKVLGHQAGAQTSLVHLAAIAHRTGKDSALDYTRVNCDLAIALATRARAAGVRRFVFISSARVMGETHATRWGPEDTPHPVGPYAQSKWSAESALREMALQSPASFEIVIARPPLIYGPGVPANFRRLMQLADSALPVPDIRPAGARSYLYLDNAVDALLFLAGRSEPTCGTHFIRDDRDWTTPDLLADLRRRMRRPMRLVRLPATLVRGAAMLAGRTALVDRLLGSATIDDSSLRTLGWRPPISPDEALDRTVAWFASNTRQPRESAP